MYVKKCGYLTPEEFNALPGWLQNKIYKRWTEYFGGLPFKLDSLYWYDISKPTGFLFDYDDDSDDDSDNDSDEFKKE